MDRRKQQHREAIKAECARRGIDIRQQGQAWLISGQGVSMLTADLYSVALSDLAPFQQQDGRV